MKNLLIAIGVVLLSLFIIGILAPKEQKNEIKKLTTEEKQEIQNNIKKQYDTIENRKIFAKKAQEWMLDQGFDMEFITTGKENRTLECKYILAGNVLAHKLSKDGTFLNTVKLYGFNKFILTDKYYKSWTWTLK